MPSSPDRQIHLNIATELQERPEYEDLNQRLGLPIQSVVLQEAIDTYGRESLEELLADVETEAPYLLTNNFFLMNLVYFVENWIRAKLLNHKIQARAACVSDATGVGAGIRHIMEALECVAKNRRLQNEDSDLLDVIERFVDSMSSHMRITSGELIKVAQLVLIGCKNEADFNRIRSTLSTCYIDSVADAIDRSGINIPQVSTMGFKILDGCTRGCSFCYEQSESDEDKWQFLETDDFDQMGDVIDNVGSVELTGGEPLEHPRIVELCQYFSDRKVPISITTTGGDIELLEQLLPFYKNGSIRSFSLSVNGMYGERTRGIASQTAAFFVKHNVSFNITSAVPDIQSPQVVMPLYEDIFALLQNQHHDAGADAAGRNCMRFYPPVPVDNRDPLITLRVVPAYPGGQHVEDARAMMNATFYGMSLRRGQGSTSAFCSFPNVNIRTDKTVTPCCSPMEGKNSDVPRLMDHLPTSMEELNQAIERYRQRLLSEVFSRADVHGVLPCLVCNGSMQNPQRRTPVGFFTSRERAVDLANAFQGDNSGDDESGGSRRPTEKVELSPDEKRRRRNRRKRKK